MNYIQQRFKVSFEYKVFFTEGLFSSKNPIFNEVLKENHQENYSKKILFVIDDKIIEHFPGLDKQIDDYFAGNEYVQLIKEKIIVAGGEVSKNDNQYLEKVIDAVNRHRIDRHSYIVGIGGGSVLDLTGYAAAIAHRGIKVIRIPTTVLSQNDSGVGVKNGVNYKGKKNFLGTFAPPFAVFNDYEFLTTLNDRDWRSGISEAIKVALIKDKDFYHWLEDHADDLVNRDKSSMEYLIKRCAELHVEHIGGGDPFEFGSSRPLDFGHWSAHKLEQLSNFEVLHGEAVAMGIALDSLYSALTGLLPQEDADGIVRLLLKMGLPVTHELMQLDTLEHPIFLGLQEFREHLGGQLTIMLLKEIGVGYEVHELDLELVMKAAQKLQNFNQSDLKLSAQC